MANPWKQMTEGPKRPPALRSWAVAAMVAVGTVCGLAAAAGAAGFAGLTRPALCGSKCLDKTVELQILAAEGPKSQNLVRAKAMTQLSLQDAPFNARSWLHLAVIEIKIGNGQLTPRALRAIKNAYLFAPVDVEIVRWRSQIVFEYWTDLDDTARAAALHELRILFIAPQNRLALHDLEFQIRNPTGRVAYGLLMRTLDARVRVEDAATS